MLKLFIFVGYYYVLESSSLVKTVESVVEAVNYCRLLCALESSNFIEAVESPVEAVHFCRLLCVLESSSFVEAVEYVDGEAVESVVVKAVDCSRLLCALVLLKMLNLLLKLLIVVGYYEL